MSTTLQRLNKYPHLKRQYELAKARLGDNCSGCDQDALLRQYAAKIDDWEKQQKIRLKRT